MRKALLHLTAALIVAGALVGGALAGGGNVVAFGTGVVTTNKNSARIVNGSGEYGGVYRNQTSVKPLRKVAFSFISTGDVQGGAPRWSIPIDTDGQKKTTEGYAFIDAANCGAAVGDNPTGIATIVSTDNNDCKVFFGTDTFANWSAFAGAHPSYQTAKDIPFVIADIEGDYSVTEISFFK